MQHVAVGEEFAERFLFPGSVFGILRNTDQDGKACRTQICARFALAVPQGLRMLQRKIAQQRGLSTARVAQDDDVVMTRDHVG